MLRTIQNEEKRLVKNRRRTPSALYGIVSVPEYQLAVSEQRGHRVYLLGLAAPNIQYPVGTLIREFSRDRSVGPEDEPSTVVGIYGTPDSRFGLTYEKDRLTQEVANYVVGSWNPLCDVIFPSDAEEIDHHLRMRPAAVSEFTETEFTYTYNGRELHQRPDEVTQIAATPTPTPVSLQQEHGFRLKSQIVLSNEAGHYNIDDCLLWASVSSGQDDPLDLSPVVEQPVARESARTSGRVSTPEWGTVSSSPLPFSDAFHVVAERLLEGVEYDSVSTLNSEPEVDLSLLPTWKDSGWSIAAAKLSEVRVQHPLAKQFALGVDGENPTPSVVNMVERIARAVEARTTDYIHSVDADGAFSFDAWLANGLFIMCEVDLYGEINAGLYRSPTGPQESFLPRITEDELLDNL